MFQFLKEMLASDQAFELTIGSFKGGVINVDEIGVTIDDAKAGWVMVPWASCGAILYTEV